MKTHFVKSDFQDRNGLLDVQCWCTAQIVKATPDEVRVGLTRECSDGCRAKGMAA